MSHIPSLTSEEAGNTYIVAHGYSQTFPDSEGPGAIVPMAAVNASDMFLGQPGFPQLASGPFQVPVNQSTLHSSHASSALSASGETRIQRRDLPPEDKENVDRACDLLILEIIETIGWDAAPKQLEVTAQECLSQAFADANHYTEWDNNIVKMFIEHVQLFCSKMASKVEAFVKHYELSNIVDPANSLQPTERRAVAMTCCEQMLANDNWKFYYLTTTTS
ncbi:hypothetical protein V8E55_003246 [Tylopilus felleus]